MALKRRQVRVSFGERVCGDEELAEVAQGWRLLEPVEGGMAEFDVSDNKSAKESCSRALVEPTRR